jgi:hypothetical protein
LIRNKNRDLGSATRRPSQHRDGDYTNEPVSNNSCLCSICGGDHNVLVIPLENGSHIVSRPFPKDNATKVNVTGDKRRATRLDLVDIFWPTEGGDM